MVEREPAGVIVQLARADAAQLAGWAAVADARHPAAGHGTSPTVWSGAIAAKSAIQLLVRPSYVLGGARWRRGRSGCVGGVCPGRSMPRRKRPCSWTASWRMRSRSTSTLCSGRRVVIGAIMQHIEEAGVHSGDSACVLHTVQVSQYHLNIMREVRNGKGWRSACADPDERAARSSRTTSCTCWRSTRVPAHDPYVARRPA